RGAEQNGRRPNLVPEPGRRVALDSQNPSRFLTLEQFLDLAEASRVDPDIVGLLADELDPQRAESVSALTAGERLPEDPAALRVSQKIAALIRDGWIEGCGYR